MIESYVKAIKKSKSDEETAIIIDKLYVKGFEDGYNDGQD
jgi:hypothetical protein